MAVYHYYLAVIPVEGIKKKHGHIPDSIRVSTETGYFEEIKISIKESYAYRFLKDPLASLREFPSKD